MIAALALAGLAHADTPDNWKFSLDGYYRTRGHIFPHLYEGQAAPGTYLQSRLRLQPQLNFEDRAKFFVMVDALDGVLWGDNASLASTALFAGDPSINGIEGVDVANIAVKRAWMEFKVPVGLLRVGRQGSNWGMGLLANDGNGFDDTFGENKTGSTYDRAIFATRPITVVTTVASMINPKVKPKDIALIAAVGVDRLVEDPLIQYYGDTCSLDDLEDGCEPTDEHGFTEERDASRRTDSWWVDTNDDVWEMIYVLMYKQDGQKFGKTAVGDITAGVYVVNRRQNETDSNVLIVDGYAKLELEGVTFEGELLHIGGKTRAITLASSDEADPLYKEADIWGYTARGGYQNEVWTAMFETGYASGDAAVTDVEFTGRALHPDHNVGLILYEEVIARVTATQWGEDARGLWSNGGVYNSRYIFPNVRFRPMKGWEIIGAYLVAWPDKPDGTKILCGPDDECEVAGTASAKTLGWEADLAIKHRYAEHINFTLEAGYAHATDRLPLKSVGLNYETDDEGHEYGNFFTIQSRIAYEF